MVFTLLRTRHTVGVILASAIGVICAYLLADVGVVLTAGEVTTTPLVYSVSELVCVLTVGIVVGLLYPDHLAAWHLHRRRARTSALLCAGIAVLSAALVVTAVGVGVYRAHATVGHDDVPHLASLLANVFLLLGVFFLTVPMMGPAAGVGAGLSVYLGLFLGQLSLWPGGTWWPLLSFRDENVGASWWPAQVLLVAGVCIAGVWVQYTTAGAARSSMRSS